MKKALLILSLCLSMACAHAPEAKPAENRPESSRFIPEVSAAEKPNLPFKLEIVPFESTDTGWSIGCFEVMHTPSFHVILTNLSKTNQAVYEDGNSWGWENLSFEFKARTGEKYLFRRVRGAFTMNFPSTFTVRPGEHKVYTIRFSPKDWAVKPAFKQSGETRGTFKALYYVWPSSNGNDSVSTGWAESSEYELTIRHDAGVAE